MSYTTITGEVIADGALSAADRQYLDDLDAFARSGGDYFEVLRRVKGPGARPLPDGRITARVAASPLYRIAHDIADRLGVEAGYLLPPDAEFNVSGLDLMSLTEAAEVIGISRQAVHEALTKGQLAGQRVGNAWVLERQDVEHYRSRRENALKGAA